MPTMEGRRRTPGLKLLLVLFGSLFLNVFFYCYVFLSHPPELGWIRAAAVEAEAVAALSCSGHGRAFLDSPLVDGLPACECNTCYSGPDCSVLLPDCPADADRGDPLFLEPYWRQNLASGTLVVPGWHRMSYRANGGSFISVELEHHIRLLHGAVGNAVSDGRFIVFGAEFGQLIDAAVYALSSDKKSSSPATIVAAVPHNAIYKGQIILFGSRGYEWKEITSDKVNASVSSMKNFLEYVTSPNNPDGRLQQSVLGGSAVIHDHAYFWPHYSAISSPADEDVMLFTHSRVSGHSSSRFWWAVIKNKRVYRNMVMYMRLNTMGVSLDTQLRVLQILKAILEENGEEGDIFEFGYKILMERWRKLNAVISSSNRFSLQQLSPQYCTYFKKIKDPSPAYAWLKCELEEERDCYAVLRDASIISRRGTAFGADSRYTRLSLIKTQDDFTQLLQRLEALVSREGISST